MDRHPLDRPICSDLSYETFQRRRRAGELTTPPLDSSNQRLVTVPGHIDRHAFIADRPGGVSEAEWHIERQRRRLQG